MRAEQAVRARAVQAESTSTREHALAAGDLDCRLRILLRHVLPPKAGGLIPARPKRPGIRPRLTA